LRQFVLSGVPAITVENLSAAMTVVSLDSPLLVRSDGQPLGHIATPYSRGMSPPVLAGRLSSIGWSGFHFTLQS
jgi:hypothetical protein